MATVYLGLGSNIDAETNLRLAVRELRLRFGRLKLSTVYRSSPVGFEGDDFLNAVARVDSALPPQGILASLEEIHALAGRRRNHRKLVSRALDIDLLLYDDLVIDRDDLRLPRNDVLEYDFVLRPLAELAPQYLHPLTGRNLAEHWRDFSSRENAVWHPLVAVDVDLESEA